MAASLTLNRLASSFTAVSSSRSTERPSSAATRKSMGMSNSAANALDSISIGSTPAAASASRRSDPRSTCTALSSSGPWRHTCPSSWASVNRCLLRACSLLMPTTLTPSRMCGEPREFIIKRRILDPDAERLGNSLDGHRGRFDAILDQQRLRRLPGFAPVGPPLHRERRFRSLPAKADSSKPCTADCCFRLNVESLTSIAGSGSPDAHVLGTRSNTDSSFRVLTRAKS